MIGPEFQVNTTTAGMQYGAGGRRYRARLQLRDLWSAGGGQDGDQTSASSGGMFDATGTPIGGEIPVNAVPAG